MVKSKGTRKNCQRCGKLMAYGSNFLCWDCHSTQHIWRPKKKMACIKCGKKVIVTARKLCMGCYSKAYMKPYHAEYERKARADGKRKAVEDKRTKTSKRILWRRKYNREYQESHRKELKEYNRKYRQLNPVKMDEYKRRSLALRAGLPSTLTMEQWEMILFKHEYKCAYCYDRIDGERLQREHNLPAIKGGGYTAENIVPACSLCNLRKKTMTGNEFRKYLIKYPNPSRY